MISDIYKLRPRYGEVDRMGYVYHANYVSYCHQARTELLRKYGFNDSTLEGIEIMAPVVDFNIKYKIPAYYDEPLSIKTVITKVTEVRMRFEFEIYNKNNEKICIANSTIAFVDAQTRKPIRFPRMLERLKEPIEIAV